MKLDRAVPVVVLLPPPALLQLQQELLPDLAGLQAGLHLGDAQLTTPAGSCTTHPPRGEEADGQTRGANAEARLSSPKSLNCMQKKASPGGKESERVGWQGELNNSWLSRGTAAHRQRGEKSEKGNAKSRRRGNQRLTRSKEGGGEREREAGPKPQPAAETDEGRGEE
jgi:hypothetical protein